MNFQRGNVLIILLLLLDSMNFRTLCRLFWLCRSLSLHFRFPFETNTHRCGLRWGALLYIAFCNIIILHCCYCVYHLIQYYHWNLAHSFRVNCVYSMYVDQDLELFDASQPSNSLSTEIEEFTLIDTKWWHSMWNCSLPSHFHNRKLNLVVRTRDASVYY